MLLTILSGLIIGIGFGFVLQKGGFCMNTAFRSIVFEKDRSIFRAWLLVLAINMVGVNLLYELRIINVTIAPFFWPAAIIGGVVFGVGMVLAGGCTSGTWYRFGKGMLGSLGALIGFAAGATMMSVGVFRPVMETLRKPVIDRYGAELTLVNIFPFDPLVTRWAIIGVLTLAILIYLLRGPKQQFVIGWKWYSTGLAVGLLALLGWVFSAYSQRDYGLSFTQPTVSLVRLLFNSDSGGINWSTYFILGVPAGALIAAILSKDFSFRIPSPGRFLQQMGGGSLMGLGAALAGGCNIGHGITGISTLSVTSITATAFTMAGVWAMTYVVYKGASLQVSMKRNRLQQAVPETRTQ